MAKVLWWDSHETVRYPLRLHEFLENWRAGLWYPRWGPNLLGGCGYPFFNFYGPSIFFLSAFFCLGSGGSTVLGLKLALVSLAALAALSSYAMVYGESEDRGAALVGAAVYVFWPYRCTNMYERGNLAEYAAYAFLPLAVWGYRSLLRARRPQAAVTAAAIAAVGHAGVLLGHSLIGFYTTELVGLFLLYQLGQKRRASWLVASAMVMALCLSAIYVLPAFLERHLVHVERTTWGPAKSYLNTISPALALGKFYTPGWPFVVATGLWLLTLALPARRAAAMRAAPWFGLAYLLWALLFHWAAPFWKALPFGPEMQFPWRILGFIGVLSAAGIGLLWKEWVSPSRSGLLLSSACLVLMPLSVLPQTRVTPSGPLLLEARAIRAENISTSTFDEYLPIRVGDNPRPARKGSAWSEDPHIQVQAVEFNGLDYRLNIQAQRAGEVVVGIYGYDGWKVSGDAWLTVGPEGFLRVCLRQPGSYQVRVFFGSTPLRSGAAWISLLSALFLIPLLRRVQVATGEPEPDNSNSARPCGR
jgi:hypothetical protein